MNRLPAEMIENICSEMDNIELAKFMQTSSENYEICNVILLQRKREYKKIIDTIIAEIMNQPTKVLKLESTDINREFTAQFAEQYSPTDIYFNFLEKYMKPVLATQKFFNWRPVSRQMKINENELTNILLDLLLNDYLTGNFSWIS